MNLTRWNILLAVLLGLTTLLAIVIRADHAEPNWEFLPEMKRSPAWSSFEANPNFEDGRTLQTPVQGTIPRGELPLHYAATKEYALRAGEELKNPYAVRTAVAEKPQGEAEPAAPLVQAGKHVDIQASIQRGAANFRVFCACCHGPGGMGDGPVKERGFPPPPPLPTGKSVEMKDGQLLHILTYGQGSMASMAAQLSRDDRWDVINYVRSLQHTGTQTQQSTDADDGSVETGEKTPTEDEP